MIFNKKRCEELKKIFEFPIIRKTRLRDIFPRKLLCTKKSALGVRLIEPKTAIDSLELNSCAGNKICKDVYGLRQQRWGKGER